MSPGESWASGPLNPGMLPRGKWSLHKPLWDETVVENFHNFNFCLELVLWIVTFCLEDFAFDSCKLEFVSSTYIKLNVEW